MSPPPPSTLAADDDPEEVDLAALHPALSTQQQQLAALGFPVDPSAGLGGPGGNPFGAFPGMAGFPGMPGAGEDGAGGEDMFAQMMAQMGAMGGGQGGAPGGGPSPFGAMGQPPTSPFPTQPKTLLDRVFPLVHLLSMVGLAWYAIAVLEPSTRSRSFGWMGKGEGIDWVGWARLATGRQGEVLTKTGEGLVVVVSSSVDSDCHRGG